MTDSELRLGAVTEQERDAIQRIHEHANGLVELEPILDASSPLRQRVTLDRAETEAARRRWWSQVAAKYDWPSPEHARWRVDFRSREV